MIFDYEGSMLSKKSTLLNYFFIPEYAIDFPDIITFLHIGIPDVWKFAYIEESVFQSNFCSFGIAFQIRYFFNCIILTKWQWKWEKILKINANLLKGRFIWI